MKNELILTESKTMRSEFIENIDVLDKIKAIQYLSKDLLLSIEQVANYYEVGTSAIESIILRNRDELDEDGLKVLKGKELSGFRKEVCDLQSEGDKISPKARAFTIIPKRAMLRIGMLLIESDVAKQVRTYLLNIQETATDEQHKWAVQRMVGKKIRCYLTDSIKDYIPESPSKRWKYKNYTDLIYKIIFDKNAKQLKQDRNIKDENLLRDSFTIEELVNVEKLEAMVGGLIAFGYDYDFIKSELNKLKIKLLS